MRILFITPFIQNMYKDIEDEMTAQGHQVFIVKDKLFRAEPFFVDRRNFRFLKRIVWEIETKHYWNQMFKKTKRLNEPFDFLFVISGTSVCRHLLDRLRKINPQIRSSIYTWDSCNFYRFDRHLDYIDKGFNFDIDDVMKDGRWTLLPIYCRKKTIGQRGGFEFDIFSIGSNHDGRYSFIKKILPQLRESNTKFFIKIVANPINLSLRGRISLLFTSKSRRKEIKEEIAFSHGLENEDILSQEKIIAQEYDKISNSSACVLDDQRENQTGLTARFMWALADGKKIITTNQAAYRYNFTNHEQVAIISKTKPYLPIDFLKNNSYGRADISPFMVDNWVRTILQ